MIPAILCCLYVIYLYQTLNQPVRDLDESLPAATAEDLVARMESLQSRLDKLEPGAER